MSTRQQPNPLLLAAEWLTTAATTQATTPATTQATTPATLILKLFSLIKSRKYLIGFCTILLMAALKRFGFGFGFGRAFWKRRATSTITDTSDGTISDLSDGSIETSKILVQKILRKSRSSKVVITLTTSAIIWTPSPNIIAWRESVPNLLSQWSTAGHDIIILAKVDTSLEEERILQLLVSSQESNATTCRSTDKFRLPEHKVIFSSTDTGMISIIKHIQPSLHIDTSRSRIEALAPFLAQQIAISPSPSLHSSPTRAISRNHNRRSSFLNLNHAIPANSGPKDSFISSYPSPPLPSSSFPSSSSFITSGAGEESESALYTRLPAANQWIDELPKDSGRVFLAYHFKDLGSRLVF